MFFYSPRIGCIGVLAQVVIVVFLGIVALICVANRTWFHEQALEMMHGEKAKLYAGPTFEPGAVVQENGMRLEAVMKDDKPYVSVANPTDAWRDEHKDADCDRKVCLVPASSMGLAANIGYAGSLLSVALAGWIMWTLIVGDTPVRAGRY